MESRNQIRQKEIESSKNYSITEHKASIIFYSVFKFLFSDLFAFIYIFFPLAFVASFYDFDFGICFWLLLTHPIIYYFIDRPAHKFFKLDKFYQELEILIEVNQEILKQKKETK
jgi:hypothetical protein